MQVFFQTKSLQNDDWNWVLEVVRLHCYSHRFSLLLYLDDKLQLSRWWQLKYFLFSPRKLGKISNLTNVFQMGWNHKLVMNRRRNVLWPQMVVRHVARQGDDGERWFSGGHGHMPLGQWDVFWLSLVSDSRHPMGQKLRNGITKHFRNLQFRYLKFFVMLQWQCSVLVEMATRGSSLFDKRNISRNVLPN